MWSAESARLREAFADACDLSLALTTAVSRRGRVLGMGEHFRVFALAGRGKAGMDLVLKLPLEDLDPREVARLKGLHGRLARRTAPLLPPMEVIDLPDGGFAVVQPRATTGWDMAAPPWQPMEETLEAALRALAERGIVLGDVAQGGTWSGIPFLYDWSDARLAQPA